jgi:hypothetical protein
VNPTLDIQALSRIRRRESERLEVRAAVQGTLVEPVVTLSTEEAGLSQSDLISYLVFGSPAADAASGSALASGAQTLGAGYVVSSLGGALAQELPFVNRLDYLSFSQQSDAQAQSNVFGGTQVELGKYLNDDVFVVFVLGGEDSGDADGGTSFTFRGVRAEFAVLDLMSIEAFWEDRFLRSGSGGLGVSGLDGEKVIGVLLFKEWGYGSNQQD